MNKSEKLLKELSTRDYNMKIIKHGNKYKPQRVICKYCQAELELSPCKDIIKDFDWNEYFQQGASYEYFICPECKERNYLYFKII